VPRPAGERWDVVVVGAGPAGAAAARSAAEDGARTLLVDRAAFPRYKTCGGGLVGASLAALPPGLQLPVRDSVTAMTFTHRGHLARTLRHTTALLATVNRDEFDAALVAGAASAGATVRDGTPLRAVHAAPGGVEVETGRGRVFARAVVGADGSAGRLGRHVGVRCPQVDLGLELELRAGAAAEAWHGRIHLDWGPLPGSYGWVFPKGDVLTVGVIAARGEAVATRAYLTDLVEHLGLASLPVLRDSGHLTRCRAETSPLARGRVLVAGDAAGLLEPWTREGISYALRSGHLAGRAAARMARLGDEGAAAVGRRYAEDIGATLGAEMRAGRALLGAFRRRPYVFHAAIAARVPAWSLLTRLITGELPYARLMVPPVRASLAALAR
jgi:geranylgeranyl reductase family protein